MHRDLTQALGAEIDEHLLEIALTHRSFAYESGGLPTYERLEFLGDSVLGLIVTSELYQRYPDLPESRLSPLRSGIVNTTALAEVARTLGLGSHIKIGKGEESSGGRAKASILADSLEALFGALYIDKGFEEARKIILPLISPLISNALEKGAGLDGKTALQELIAERNLGVPEYVVTDSGPDHDKSFVAQVLIRGEVVGRGEGKSKREAEQIAATLAFTTLSGRA
ncbi:MAG: ribonuclease III [Actinobacteria bacterium]|uniref:Ribonuclease 3 n=1 Tax=Candidatus Fonsibacter lacus TaxID=2576439 RepID=A0A965LKJ1_9PROT|nr:ribonuclease III [Candidatus Fonsibacter lacus]